ncbi:hypothetical protein ABIB56_003371, partial [Glaciihabitans sp. UYNi722]
MAIQSPVIEEKHVNKRLVATVILMVALVMDLMDSTITNVALP